MPERLLIALYQVQLRIIPFAQFPVRVDYRRCRLLQGGLLVDLLRVAMLATCPEAGGTDRIVPRNVIECDRSISNTVVNLNATREGDIKKTIYEPGFVAMSPQLPRSRTDSRPHSPRHETSPPRKFSGLQQIIYAALILVCVRVGCDTPRDGLSV